MESTFTIVPAETPPQRVIAYQLRYRVFVEELHYRIPEANPNTGIIEEMDKASKIFLAYDGGVPVGTIAVAWWKEVEFDKADIAHFYLRHFAQGFSQEAIAIMRKAAVSQPYRQSTLFMKLILAAAEVLVSNPAIHFVFNDCSPYLIHYYDRMGFRGYAPHFSSAASESLSVPMCLVISDLEYLERRRALLFPVIKQYHRDHHRDVQRYFQEHWTVREQPSRADLESIDLLDPYAELSPAMAVHAFPLFGNIERRAVDTFLALCKKITFHAGDVIITAGDQNTDLYLLTQGYVEVIQEKNGEKIAIATRGRGDLLGEMNMLLGTGRSASVVALTDIEAVRIPESVFRGAFEKTPTFMAQLNFNLAKMLARRLQASGSLITEPPPLGEPVAEHHARSAH